MKLWNTLQLAVALLLAVAGQRVLAIEDLQMSSMNRALEFGQEGSLYLMQPVVIPGVLPNILRHPETIYRMQPHVAASIYQMQPRIDPLAYQMQPQIDPLAYQMQPEINPETYDDGLEGLGVPVNFNRPLDMNPSTYNNRRINGTDPNYYNRGLTMGRPMTFNIIPDDEDPDEVSTIAPTTIPDSTPIIDTTPSLVPTPF